MNWLVDIFTQQTFIQAVLVISLISAAGIALGKVKIFGINLGVTFVFFAGIMAGHFGFVVNPDMLAVMQNFGLILFIYALGVQVGPGFFSSLKRGGFKLNMLAFLLLVAGTVMAIILHWCTGISMSDMMGLFSGAVTNTPMLGAAQQSLLQMHPDQVEAANNMAMACAVGYPFGLLGMIACIVVINRMYTSRNTPKKAEAKADNTFITEYQVSNPAIFGKMIKEIREQVECQFVISRIWKNGKVIIPTSETVIEKNEHILVISGKKDIEKIKTLFGQQETSTGTRRTSTGMP